MGLSRDSISLIRRPLRIFWDGPDTNALVILDYERVARFESVSADPIRRKDDRERFPAPNRFCIAPIHG